MIAVDRNHCEHNFIQDLHKHSEYQINDNIEETSSVLPSFFTNQLWENQPQGEIVISVSDAGHLPTFWIYQTFT